MALLCGEHQSCRRGLAHANAQEVDLQARLLLSNIGVHLQHVGLKDGCVIAVEVQRVVLKERRAAGQSLAHEPCGAVQTGTLPVALGTEAIAVVHQALRRKARDLVEAVSGLFYVDIAKVVEVGCESLGIICLQHRTNGQLSLGGVPDLLILNTLLVLELFVNDILLEVDIMNKGIDILILNLVEVLHDG